MNNQTDLNAGCVQEGALGETGNGEALVGMNHQCFIDICNDSGWVIFPLTIRLEASCGDAVCAVFSRVDKVTRFYPKAITKPSRIKMDDVVKLSHGNAYRWCHMKMTTEELGEVCEKQGWEKHGGSDDYLNSEGDLMAFSYQRNFAIFYSGGG